VNKSTADQLLRDTLKIALQSGISPHEITWIVDDMTTGIPRAGVIVKDRGTGTAFIKNQTVTFQ
jgi:hypothetical protein